jgi:type II secretion system protein N
VKKLSRFLLVGLGAVLALGIILLLAVNLYVQSQATQARIQQELSQRIGTSLHIRRISVTPWSGLKLSGITIPQTNPTVVGDFLEAKTFRLRIQFASLFSQRLVIKEISLIKPNVVWRQNADGKWRLPELAASSTKLVNTPESTSFIASPPQPASSSGGITAKATASRSKGAPVEPKTENKKPSTFVPEIRRVNLADGGFHFLDGNGHVVATFTGVDFRSSLRSATAVRGTVKIAKTSLRDRFFLEQLQSPLQYDPTALDFSQVSAQAAGGQITGGFSMRPQEQESPFTARIRFHDLQADRIVTEAGGPKGIVQGRLEGRLEAAGKTADANALIGQGEIYLRDGEVQQYSLLIALGQILQIEELTQLHLDEAHVRYHLSPGLVTIDDLLLHSPNIRLSATGTITFAGKLRLESQLAVNEKIRGQLFRAIRDNFQPTSEPGYGAVAFQISGTVERPKTNLMDKLVGRDLKDLGSVLNSLFGGGKTEHSKKKKEPPDIAPATPASPAPVENAAPTPSPSVLPKAPQPESTAALRPPPTP